MGCDHAARALMEALRSGRIKCTGCPVEGLPYTSAGPLRPVKLLHCGCTLSAHAADKCVAERRCLLCRRVRRHVCCALSKPPLEAADGV